MNVVWFSLRTSLKALNTSYNSCPKITMLMKMKMQYSLAASCCLFRKETERRQEGASSATGAASVGSVASGEGARPLGGFESATFMISGAGAGFSGLYDSDYEV